MRAYDIIARKRDGHGNSQQEIAYMINGYVQGSIPDEQVAAWLMSIYFQGMTAEETALLTKIMMDSGDVLDLSAIGATVLDKHSTGGVGDKTTLVVAPLVAAAGVPVAKLSGKGLGFTGGTIDKLEAIPHMQTALSNEAFIQQVRDIGLAVIGQTAHLVPADKKLYALRDITATVECIPLIASSIMSKKLAAGAQKIVLDVKYGAGAFMKDRASARDLAQTMVDIGKNLHRETAAIISSMEQPLGMAVGNALEVTEAVAALRGDGPDDLAELCLTLAGEMFCLYGRTATLAEGRGLAKEMLVSGKGLQKFVEFVQYQGGDSDAVVHNALPAARLQSVVTAEVSGYICAINAQNFGLGSMLLGAGREKKEDVIDLSAGIMLQKKVGDYVHQGDPLAVLYYNPPYQHRMEEVSALLAGSYVFSEAPVPPAEMIAEIIH